MSEAQKSQDDMSGMDNPNTAIVPNKFGCVAKDARALDMTTGPGRSKENDMKPPTGDTNVYRSAQVDETVASDHQPSSTPTDIDTIECHRTAPPKSKVRIAKKPEFIDVAIYERLSIRVRKTRERVEDAKTDDDRWIIIEEFILEAQLLALESPDFIKKDKNVHYVASLLAGVNLCQRFWSLPDYVYPEMDMVELFYEQAPQSERLRFLASEYTKNGELDEYLLPYHVLTRGEERGPVAERLMEDD